MYKIISEHKKAAGVVGMATKAGKVICGYEPIKRNFRTKAMKAYAIVVSTSLSDRALERICKLGEEYQVPIVHSGQTSEELAKMVGRPTKSLVASVAILDEDMAAPLLI